MKLLPSKEARQALTLIGVLYVAPPLILVAFVLLTLVAGPLVAVLVIGTVGGNVALMRRYYREHRARQGTG